MKFKFNRELTELVDNKVISEDTAIRITEYYRYKEKGQSNPLFMIFGIFGSALVGLGVILILAHNWDHLSRPIKTIFAFLPLLIGQVLSGIAILKNKSRAWKESAGTFLFFSIGASIALVSQIYHIPGDLSSYLLLWISLGLPLIYLLDSKAVDMLVIILATYYAVELGYSFNGGSRVPWLYFLIMLGTLPFYISALLKSAQANSTGILNWLYAVSLMISLGTCINSNWALAFLMYALLFGMYYNLGYLNVYRNGLLRRNSFKLLGSLGTVVLLVVFSFNGIWEDVESKVFVVNSQELIISVLLFVSALVLLGFSYKKRTEVMLDVFQFVFLVFVILFAIGTINAGLATVLTNSILLLLGLFAVKSGTERLSFGILNYGLLIISVTIICRFFDTDMSFVLRGILFVLVGLGFFLTNYFMFKKQKSIQS
ncbi:putative membrane protein [Winogradskyella epiphytica]|uniref:Putative membrane protein n=1 Tax=Winogradskyella epiphytica TaxID=262005 RepID=A0A2V4XS60_9FLAO|nr:DUF2157 domain-containing protein [Winogradskyella epiphytica]PYE80771.1 putative membrane protein [Winogradskyella epiphytica]GGW68343.1 hypothetical protein GCM10008085_20340 [Winogradskyella epiphytica]